MDRREPIRAGKAIHFQDEKSLSFSLSPFGKRAGKDEEDPPVGGKTFVLGVLLSFSRRSSLVPPERSKISFFFFLCDRDNVGEIGMQHR